MSELVLKYNKKELEELSKDVIELHETFQMVNEMIAIQGDKIESLEDSIDDTLNEVECANKELIISNDLQKSVNTKKMIITGIGLTALGISAGSIIGYSVGIPVVLVGFGCYKIIDKTQKLFKDKTDNNN
jgi:hypothetical protein